jgi:hypothetical protein
LRFARRVSDALQVDACRGKWLEKGADAGCNAYDFCHEDSKSHQCGWLDTREGQGLLVELRLSSLLRCAHGGAGSYLDVTGEMAHLSKVTQSSLLAQAQVNAVIWNGA